MGLGEGRGAEDRGWEGKRRELKPIWLGLGWSRLPRISGPFPLGGGKSGLGLWGGRDTAARTYMCVHTAPPTRHGACWAPNMH